MFGEGRFQERVKMGMWHFSAGVSHLFLKGFKHKFSVGDGDGGHKP